MIFKQTHYVAIELSNLCNYSAMHKKCPAHNVTEKKILSANATMKALDCLGTFEYDKSIAFYLYSDSLNDPRIYNFLSYAKTRCPKACNIVGTNGWYLNLEIAIELYHSGADYICVTAYTEKEYLRFQKIRDGLKTYPGKPIAFGIRRVESLDERLNMEGNVNGKCFAPLTEIIIKADGRVVLCCLDMECKEVFGNVNKDSLSDILNKNYSRLEQLRNELSEGKRTLELCKECSFSRWISVKEHGKDIRFANDLVNGNNS